LCERGGNSSRRKRRRAEEKGTAFTLRKAYLNEERRGKNFHQLGRDKKEELSNIMYVAQRRERGAGLPASYEKERKGENPKGTYIRCRGGVEKGNPMALGEEGDLPGSPPGGGLFEA